MVNKKSDKPEETTNKEQTGKPKKKGRIYGDPLVVLNE